MSFHVTGVHSHNRDPLNRNSTSTLAKKPFNRASVYLTDKYMFKPPGVLLLLMLSANGLHWQTMFIHTSKYFLQPFQTLHSVSLCLLMHNSHKTHYLHCGQPFTEAVASLIELQSLLFWYAAMHSTESPHAIDTYILSWQQFRFWTSCLQVWHLMSPIQKDAGAVVASALFY